MKTKLIMSLVSGPKRVIIFNHKRFASRFHLNERKGTELDVHAIKSAFKSISWDTEVYNDPTVSDIRYDIGIF